MTYLICNAHIDPVWLWRWDEGASETLSTFRAAADLLDTYPDLIFCHNESLLYEWIELYDPALFERIRRYVKEGRWEVMGGWFLQPDCNLPTGESLLRQVLKGRAYFKDTFNVVTRTAVNFDSFGHARGLVQLLAQCGYEQYIVCRPGKGHYDFPDADFVWKGYDGSQIVVHRSDENYNSIKGKVGGEIEQWRAEHPGDTLFLWGVGNHGGGPSRKDLDDIADLMAGGADIRHAVPSDYFKTLDSAALPVVEEGLNRIIEGCYTSQIRIKQRHRQLECDLQTVEHMAVHAKSAGLAEYEHDLIEDAWRDLLLSEFHDALPGSGIQPVEEDTLRTLDHGLEITARLKTRYFFALTAGQERLIEGTIPIMVYNPHPFPARVAVECPFVLPAQNWNVEFSKPIVTQNGQTVRGQGIKEDGNFNMDWCKRVVFEADLPAMTMSRYDVRFEKTPSRPLPTLKAVDGLITVTGARASMVVSALTGLLESYRVDGKEYLKSGACALEVYEDGFNPWSGPKEGLTLMGAFAPMSTERATAFAAVKGDPIEAVRVIEQGDMRTSVEALMEYGDSRAVVRYMLDMQGASLELELMVFFGEKEKRLKLRVPSVLKDACYRGQTVFGRERLDVCPGEYVSQQWSCIDDGNHALSIANDGVYGSDFADGSAGITLLRSAGYGASHFVLGSPYTEPMYMPRMEQGERRYRFVITGGGSAERLAMIDREAALLNQKPYALAYCPSGEGEKPAPLMEIDRENVVLSCAKRALKDEDAYIIRVYEAQGTRTDFTITMPGLGITHRDTLEPFRIKTYRLKNGALEETDILEGIA